MEEPKDLDSIDWTAAAEILAAASALIGQDAARRKFPKLAARYDAKARAQNTPSAGAGVTSAPADASKKLDAEVLAHCRVYHLDPKTSYREALAVVLATAKDLKAAYRG